MLQVNSTIEMRRAAHKRKPAWLKIRLPAGENYNHIKATLRKYDLHTVCEGAHCPNVGECWGRGTATLMLMGDICTRGCRFCAVNSGKPKPLDPLEPWKIAQAVQEWGLNYVVLTSVCRDDLSDGGAAHFARAITAIKERNVKAIVEALIPDFRGDIEALKLVVQAKPQVIGHNLETVERLTPKVRDRRASYRRSLTVLENIKRLDPEIYTKSSLMLGLGETEEEVLQAMRDLRKYKVDLLTLGQYLQPSPRHLKVIEYVNPEKFDYFKRQGEELGFKYVASGPLVRSSWHAETVYKTCTRQRNEDK